MRRLLCPTICTKGGWRMLNRSDLLIVGLYVLWETVDVLCIAWAKDPVTQASGIQLAVAGACG